MNRAIFCSRFSSIGSFFCGFVIDRMGYGWVLYYCSMMTLLQTRESGLFFCSQETSLLPRNDVNCVKTVYIVHRKCEQSKADHLSSSWSSALMTRFNLENFYAKWSLEIRLVFLKAVRPLSSSLFFPIFIYFWVKKISAIRMGTLFFLLVEPGIQNFLKYLFFIKKKNLGVRLFYSPYKTHLPESLCSSIHRVPPFSFPFVRRHHDQIYDNHIPRIKSGLPRWMN